VRGTKDERRTYGKDIKLSLRLRTKVLTQLHLTTNFGDVNGLRRKGTGWCTVVKLGINDLMRVWSNVVVIIIVSVVLIAWVDVVTHATVVNILIYSPFSLYYL
jgi:hypothetical protein